MGHPMRIKFTSLASWLTISPYHVHICVCVHVLWLFSVMLYFYESFFFFHYDNCFGIGQIHWFYNKVDLDVFIEKYINFSVNITFMKKYFIIRCLCTSYINFVRVSTFYNVNFIILFVYLFGFYGISTFVSYSTPNPFLYKWTILFWTIQFSISTQFNRQKHFYFKLFSFVRQF